MEAFKAWFLRVSGWREVATVLCVAFIVLTACGGGGSSATVGETDVSANPGHGGTTQEPPNAAPGSPPALPPQDPDSMVIGVATHMAFGWPRARVMERLHSIGTLDFRDEAFWPHYERAPGVYDVRGLAPGIQDALAGRIDVSRSMLTLGYGHPRHENGRRPVTEAGIQAFVDYAVAVIRDGGHRFGYIQIWNEWNNVIGSTDTNRGDAADYARLFKAVAQAIRPLGNFKIITTGAVDWFDGWRFQRGIIANGVLEYADGFGHHSYNWRNGMASRPAELMRRLDELQRLLTTANGGKPFPIYISEYGWPTWNAAGYSDEQAGRWIAEFIASTQARGDVKGIWLYDLFDDGTDRDDPEHGFGLFTTDGREEKPRTAIVRDAIVNARK